MLIALMSDTILPTPYAYGHGLGRAVYNLGRELIRRGHEVTLFGLDGSEMPGGEVVTTRGTEEELAEMVKALPWPYAVAIDAGHKHVLANEQPIPTLAWFQDKASKPAPNAVFVSDYCRSEVGIPGEIVRNAIVPDEFPLYEGRRGYWVTFLGSTVWHKGQGDAIQAAALAGLPLYDFGHGCRYGPITGTKKVRELQRAIAILCPYQIDAGPQVPLEAMACGTPVIGFAKCAMMEYVPLGGGFLTRSVEDMAKSVYLAQEMKPSDVRAAVLDAGFTVERQGQEMEDLLTRLLDGETW